MAVSPPVWPVAKDLSMPKKAMAAPTAANSAPNQKATENP